MFFKIIKKHSRSRARLGIIKTEHGTIQTPAFLPVATKATIKGLSPKQIEEIGFKAILANTYHLYLQPGSDKVKKLGGLHKFMNWPGPIATDSGGYQVFSLGCHKTGKVLKSQENGLDSRLRGNDTKKRGNGKLVKIDKDGVTFTSHLDGSLHRFTPEKSIKIQEDLGADLIFAFDECTSPLAGYDYTKKSMEITHQWAERCLKVRRRKGQFLFGIVQGGPFKDLRKQSAQFIAGLDFDGLAIGGSFGQGEMKKTLDWVMPHLPENKPRHLLGIGYLNDLKEAVKRGIDLFDCVYPTRLGRHGTFLTDKGEINIIRKTYQLDKKPIMNKCSCYVCQNFSRAYLHHLFRANEMLGPQLATYHNLWFMARFMEKIREAIKKGGRI
jgi:queuine tRNA-ribosyltransferase